MDRSTYLPRVVAGPRKRLMMRLLLNGFAQAASAFAMAWLMRRAFTGTALQAAPTTATVLAIVAGLVLAGVVLLGLRVLQRTDAERLGQDYVMKVRLRLFTRIAAAPLRSDKAMRFGLTMNRMITDLNSLKNWVSMGVARMAVAAVSITGSLAALTYFNPVGGAAATMLVGLCVGSGWLLTPALRARVKHARRQRGALAGNLGEKVFAIHTVGHFGKSRREWVRLRGQSRRLAHAMVHRVQLAGVLRSLPDAALPLSIALMIGLTAVSQSRVAELATTLLLLGLITNSLRDVAQAWDYRLSFEEAHRRLTTILAHPRLRDARHAKDVAGDGPVSLAFENVQVADVLTQVSVTAGAGEHVLVTGPTGAGKSTLIALAARLFDPDQGQVLLDGQHLRGVSLASIHRTVQLVSPTLPLMRGTVSSNIMYGARADDDRQIVSRVVELCGLDETSHLLPQGLATAVQEKGANMPEGLRARIALARAVAARPRLLLIDDPAFIIDAQAREALRRITTAHDVTALVVGIESDTPIPVHRVWHLNRGRIAEKPSTTQGPSVNDGPLRAIK